MPDNILSPKRIAAQAFTDAAAAVVLMEAKACEKNKVKPMARLVAYAHAGVDPQLMGLGPIPAVKKVFDMARKVGPTPSTVLITGESGTGKELLARAVHRFAQAAKAEAASLPFRGSCEHDRGLAR